VWFSWIEDAIEGLAGGTGHNFRFPVAAEAAASAAQIHFFARCQQLQQQGETFCGFWGAYPPLVPPSETPLTNIAIELPQRMHKLLFPRLALHLLPNVAATFLVGRARSLQRFAYTRNTARKSGMWSM